MSARLNAAELDRALLARGMESSDLVRLSGISAPTMSRLRRGGAVTATTLRKLVSALDAVPVNPLAAALLVEDADAAVMTREQIDAARAAGVGG